MPFGLTIGTERALKLQNAIQNELTKRGYSPDADPVMAEYITIMVINNKTPAQITSELEDLIGTDFDPTFTEWLFLEAAKGANEEHEQPQAGPSTTEGPSPISEAPPLRQVPPHMSNDSSMSRRHSNPRTGVYQQTMAQVFPSTSGQKRLSSARSPSPSGHPNKSRRTEVPIGPRAMLRDAQSSHSNPKSLLDRVGGPAGSRAGGGSNNMNGGFVQDDVQHRIDNIVNNSPDMMMANGFPRMDVNPMAAAAGIAANPLMLQEMMMNQMALMAQMASSMGMMNGAAPFVGSGFSPMQNMQGGGGDMGMFQSGGINNGFQAGHGLNGSGMHSGGRGRGSGRGGGRFGRDRAGSTTFPSSAKIEPMPAAAPTGDAATSLVTTEAVSAPIVTPAPNSQAALQAPSATAAIATTTTSQRIPYAVPERPQSPTLCKYSTRCTNPHCRYAHPSPVATAESGVVLSNETCEKGKECQDKDCIKSHVSPSVLNSQLVEQAQPPVAVVQPVQVQTGIPCRFGAACTRPGCAFIHPSRPVATTATLPGQSHSHFVQQCRYGAGCTRAACPFQHPEGRVLPTSFHRGLATTGPIVTVPNPETGSMGSSNSPHKSVTFNQPAGATSAGTGGVGPGLGLGVKEKMQQQLKEIEERKQEAEKAVRKAEAAAAGSNSRKKDESKPVAIAA